ncbi:MAG: RNA polymerase sigma factor [Planctomycetaceae bacterium]|nr:RNA polymerase sigma factor [Planctomycetaceae bacterium]
MVDWNPDVWNLLLRRYLRPLSIYAAQFSIDEDDVVQEAFLELFQQPTPPENVAAWLYQVVRHKSISAIRSNSRRRQREQTKSQQNDNWFEERPDDQLDARQVTDQLKELPDDQREVLVLKIWSNFTFTEIAELTDSSSSTCHRLYQQAIDELRKQAGLPCPNTNP